MDTTTVIGQHRGGGSTTGYSTSECIALVEIRPEIDANHSCDDSQNHHSKGQMHNHPLHHHSALQLYKVPPNYNANLDTRRRFTVIPAEDYEEIWIKRENM